MDILLKPPQPLMGLFFHVPLSEKSKMLTGMLTPYGTYVFNFLPMGCSCSGDLFEACIHELFSDQIEQGQMTNIAHDILCYGANEREHDINVFKFLDRCVEVDMHLNPRKVKFKSPEVPKMASSLILKRLRQSRTGPFQRINSNYRVSWD